MFCAVRMPQATVSAARQVRCAWKADDFNGFLRIAWSLHSTSCSTGSARSNQGGQVFRGREDLSGHCEGRVGFTIRVRRVWLGCSILVAIRGTRWVGLCGDHSCLPSIAGIHGSRRPCTWVLLGLVDPWSAIKSLGRSPGLRKPFLFSLCAFSNLEPPSSSSRAWPRSQSQDEGNDSGQAASTASSSAQRP